MGRSRSGRGVLDRMTAHSEHLLRNAVVHGIESPADRAVLGKNGVGTITMAVSQKAMKVAVDVRDDGGGLHLQRIRDRTVAMGPAGGRFATHRGRAGRADLPVRVQHQTR